MMSIEILTIQETGPSYVRLQAGDRSVQINFADDDTFSKEDSAGFFRGLVGKPAAIPVDGPMFVGVDFWRDYSGQLKTVPFHFAIESVERF
jgi:hypothetical protein